MYDTDMDFLIAIEIILAIAGILIFIAGILIFIAGLFK